MEKPTLLAKRNSFGKIISIIQPIINLSYLRKFIFIIADTLKHTSGFSYTENSIRNIMFLVTMGTGMKSFPHMVTDPVESDDVT
jgi:hypothetical protein